MATYDWADEMDRCEWCGDDHGDGLTCREVERWQYDMGREEEAMMDAPWRERSAWEASRIWLVRVGDRVYYSDDTERIAAHRAELLERTAAGRREAALRLWFTVWRWAPTPAAPAAPVAAPVPAAAPVTPVSGIRRREWVEAPRKPVIRR